MFSIMLTIIILFNGELLNITGSGKEVQINRQDAATSMFWKNWHSVLFCSLICLSHYTQRSCVSLFFSGEVLNLLFYSVIVII